jgi:hypothetical protein
VRLYLKLIAVVFSAFATQHYVLTNKPLWFGIRCQYAMVTHNQQMLQHLTEEAQSIDLHIRPTASL